MNSEISPTPLTVIGAGPAGIHAAYAAAQAGVAVTLVDENQFPGGQYYRQAPPEIKLPGECEHAEAGSVYALLDHPKIRVLSNRIVWGIFEERILALADSKTTSTLSVDKVVLATGAYERPLAFPGWTLPGVMGAGATMRMVKTQGLLPGKRVLLAGLGPLQLPLASLLLKLGVDVVCIAEAARLFSGLTVMPPMLENPDRIREAVSYISTLMKYKTRYLFNHTITRVEGKEQVEQATIAALDRNGKPIPGTERSYEVDCVCLGYGFLPLFQLPVAFRCELKYDQDLRWYLPDHKENMETTIPGVFVAGDVTDMGGAKVAAAEGRVAGLTAAYQLGSLNEAEYYQQVQPSLSELRRLNRLARAFQKMYAFPEGLSTLADDETVICRCEEITLGKLKQVLAYGVENLSQVKRLSRAGMGYCQGRNCSVLVAPYVNSICGQPLNTVTPFTIRPPLHPVPLEVITSGALMDYDQQS
ncbi:MAG: NAD(P)/FAD-dependent oxidoreductase [Chloroflexota bacterium]